MFRPGNPKASVPPNLAQWESDTAVQHFTYRQNVVLPHFSKKTNRHSRDDIDLILVQEHNSLNSNALVRSEAIEHQKQPCANKEPCATEPYNAVLSRPYKHRCAPTNTVHRVACLLVSFIKTSCRSPNRAYATHPLALATPFHHCKLTNHGSLHSNLLPPTTPLVHRHRHKVQSSIRRSQVRHLRLLPQTPHDSLVQACRSFQ